MAAWQIFYTIENEYSPERNPPESGAVVRRRVSQALSDKLYVSPALDTASWCNETGYTVYLYVHTELVSTQYWHVIFHFSTSSSDQFLSNSKCIALLGICVLTCLPDIFIFTLYLGQNSDTQPTTGLLPLVFGLPFAQEISSLDFRSSPSLALVSQNVITYWSNFAHSG